MSVPRQLGIITGIASLLFREFSGGTHHNARGIDPTVSEPSRDPALSNEQRQWHREQQQWHIVQRWQEYQGELRANLLRVIAIGAFYAIELLQYHGFALFTVEPAIAPATHRAITLLCAGWTLFALAVLLCLRRRFFPPALKFISVAGDLAMLTAVLTVADGVRSPATVAYFVILALATLRFSLPLMWFTSLGALVSYGLVLGYDRWFREYEGTPQHLPRYQQVMFAVALLLTGLVLGQVIRRVRGVAMEFAARLSAAQIGEREAWANHGERP